LKDEFVGFIGVGVFDQRVDQLRVDERGRGIDRDDGIAADPLRQLMMPGCIKPLVEMTG